jgi:hypothetical protein
MGTPCKISDVYMKASCSSISCVVGSILFLSQALVLFEQISGCPEKLNGTAIIKRYIQ